MYPSDIPDTGTREIRGGTLYGISESVVNEVKACGWEDLFSLHSSRPSQGISYPIPLNATHSQSSSPKLCHDRPAPPRLNSSSRFSFCLLPTFQCNTGQKARYTLFFLDPIPHQLW